MAHWFATVVNPPSDHRQTIYEQDSKDGKYCETPKDKAGYNPRLAGYETLQ